MTFHNRLSLNNPPVSITTIAASNVTVFSSSATKSATFPLLTTKFIEPSIKSFKVGSGSFPLLYQSVKNVSARANIRSRKHWKRPNGKLSSEIRNIIILSQQLQNWRSENVNWSQEQCSYSQNDSGSLHENS